MSKVQLLKLSDNELAIKFKLPVHAIAIVKELQRRRESLGECNWRPLWESVSEVAVVYHMQRINRALTAKIFGLSEKTLERLDKAIRVEKQVPLFSHEENRVIKVSVNEDELEKFVKEQTAEVEEIIEKYEYLYEKQILTKFLTIREFIENPVRVEQRSREQYYSDDQVNDTLRAIATLLMFIRKNKQKYKVPLNVDVWSKEHENELARAITDLCVAQGYVAERKLLDCRARIMGAIRRIKKFYDMGLFQGMIGAVVKRVTPKETFMSLDQYRKLYEHYVATSDSNYRAWFEIMSLHLLTGAREGYGAVIRKAKKLAKASNNNVKPYAIDIDSELVETSLIGLKWSSIIFTEDNDIVIKIFESKTGEEWRLLGCWLGSWFVNILKERHEFAQQYSIKSVVKTILVYYGINATTVDKFMDWYIHYTEKYTEKLLNVKLNPHRIRASHISILYELGIPLELIVRKAGGFGVGWSDINTAIEFYWRLTSARVHEYMKRAKELASKLLFS